MAFSAFTSNTSVITQTVGGSTIDKTYFVGGGHTFGLGEAVYLNSDGNITKAKADTLSTSCTIGIVKAITAEEVSIVYQGEFSVDSATTGLFPLVTGNVYYLSPTVSGGITATSPTSSSLVVQPLLVAKGSYSGIIVNSLPKQNFGFTSLFTPVGTMLPYGGKANNIPGNWVICAGDALQKGSTGTDPYYDLYSAVGDKFSVTGIVKGGVSSTGSYAYINFDGAVEDAPTYGSGIPGSTKNHSLVNDDVYKITWGTKQAVAKIYSGVGTTSQVILQFVAAITGVTDQFTGLVEATEVTVGSLYTGEAVGYTSDKFFLPDLRGRMIIGAGRGIGLTNRTVGGMGGEESHTLTLSETPSHRHTIGLRNSDNISGSAQYLLGGTAGGSVNAVLSTDTQANKAVTDMTGGGQAHENMSPYISTNWIIRYKSNIGQPGIEVGPKGEQGSAGAAGSTGVAGSIGATGSTGYATGTVSYRYTGVSTPPNGYWTESAGQLTVSSLEDTNINISNYIETWDDSNNATKGVVFIRDSYNSPSFFRIYNITGSPVTGSASGNVYYNFPVTSLVSSGSGQSGSAYTLMFIPSSSNGLDGATGATGATGAVGSQGNTGNDGITGATGPAGADAESVSSFTTPSNSTVYVDPDSSIVNPSSSYFPYNFSSVAGEPSSFQHFKASLSASSVYGFSELSELRSPAPIDTVNIVKYNFNYSVTGDAPCGGNCEGSSTYYNFANTVKIQDSSVSPAQTDLVLSANKTYSFDAPIVIKENSYGIYAQSGSFFTKTPTGLSASYQNSSAGSTGRNYLNIDIYGDTNNVQVGNYVSIRPEHFGLTSAASATGYQTLCGIYKVSAVDYTTDTVRVIGAVSHGQDGAVSFTGSLVYPSINTIDVYTTVVQFNNSSGFIVEPGGTLILGKPSIGDPFVVVYAQGSTAHQASKGLSVLGGKVYLNQSMGFSGWPVNGAAIYATNGGSVQGIGTVGSSNGTFVYADSNSSINLYCPLITQNDTGFISKGSEIIVRGATGAVGNTRFISANNDTLAILTNNAVLNIKDSRPQIISSSYQLGILANKSSLTIEGSTAQDGAIVGLTGVTGVHGISLNAGSYALVELNNITMRSAVTGGSNLQLTRKTGTVVSPYVGFSSAGSAFISSWLPSNIPVVVA